MRDEALAKTRRPLLLGVLVAFALASAYVWSLARLQPAGVDFAPLWTGARVALSDPARLYDFRYVTELQGWPLGPDKLRPFAYPPTLALILAPFAGLPFLAAYGLWMAASGALFLAAGLKARAPWWFVVFAPVSLVVYAGQVTFLVGALMLFALALRNRPWLAGVLWGLAACVKPQMLVFAPLGLLAEGRWRSLAGAAAAGLLTMALSAAAFGVQPWFEWVGSLGRFHDLVFSDPELAGDAATPYGVLVLWGLPGWPAYLLVPVMAVLVWIVFRRTQDVTARLAAVAGAAMLSGPYALAYDRAVIAPAVAAGLIGTLNDRRWLLSVACAALYALIAPLGFLGVLGGMAMPWLAARAGRDHSAA
ncbi:glycosyltransferase family 87 protein [Phenylobacterium sp. VNQ135]|uniref:glycosyltransferase family 87 protein n=1 Tax=Phenylobacterium sp. VNQ135 TaxID=3400922 RepID=UPI003C11D795